MSKRNYFFIAVIVLTLAFGGPRDCLAGSSSGLELYTSADVGFGFVDEDGFLLLLIEQGLSWSKAELRLSAPLKFRVADRTPKDNGVLRQQDWDEPSDFARILRVLAVNHEWDDGDVSFYFGELNGVSLGLGSVVDKYFNSTDMDHYQGGALLNLNFAGNGAELMLDNVIAPEIFFGRVFVAPISWFSKSRFARRLEIGLTAGADFLAPVRLDDRSTNTIPAVGGDLSFKVVDDKQIVVLPYAELGFMDGSPGFHAGAAANWVISERKELALNLRGEYRRVVQDYHPSLFNPFYEYNRRHFPYNDIASLDPTLADHLADIDPPDGNGFMADASFVWEKGFKIGVRYDREGAKRPHWLLGRIEVFPKKSFSLALYYAGQDIEGGPNLFSLDALMGVAVRAKIWGPISSFFEFTRRWRRVSSDMSFANETGFGFGVFASY